MLIIYSLVEGTIHFVAIHQRWLGKCLKRTSQKRLHYIIIFCSRIIISRDKTFVSVHIITNINFPLAHFQVWRLQAALGEQSEITKCTKQEYERLQNVLPLAVTAFLFSIWSIFTYYALTQKESFRSKLSTIRALGSVILILMIICWELNCWLCYGMSYCHCLLIVITFYTGHR